MGSLKTTPAPSPFIPHVCCPFWAPAKWCLCVSPEASVTLSPILCLYLPLAHPPPCCSHAAHHQDLPPTEVCPHTHCRAFARAAPISGRTCLVASLLLLSSKPQRGCYLPREAFLGPRPHPTAVISGLFSLAVVGPLHQIPSPGSTPEEAVGPGQSQRQAHSGGGVMARKTFVQ